MNTIDSEMAGGNLMTKAETLRVRGVELTCHPSFEVQISPMGNLLLLWKYFFGKGFASFLAKIHRKPQFLAKIIVNFLNLFF